MGFVLVANAFHAFAQVSRGWTPVAASASVLCTPVPVSLAFWGEGHRPGHVGVRVCAVSAHHMLSSLLVLCQPIGERLTNGVAPLSIC